MEFVTNKGGRIYLISEVENSFYVHEADLDSAMEIVTTYLRVDVGLDEDEISILEARELTLEDLIGTHVSEEGFTHTQTLAEVAKESYCFGIIASTDN